MATKDMMYDHPTYTIRCGANAGEAGGAATTQYGKFVAFTAMLAFSAQLTVSTAGTAAAHGFQVIRISGTTTTALGTSTLGVSAAGQTRNLLFTATGGIHLAQGDILAAVSLADVVGKAVVSYEVGVQPQATVTL